MPENKEVYATLYFFVGHTNVNFAALRICVFAFLLIEISSRKAVPEVTSTFPGPLHNVCKGPVKVLGTSVRLCERRFRSAKTPKPKLLVK